MSAVIWFGIVAVWAFVLIPTWVRRSDINWRRSGDSTSARDRLGRAARVVSRSGSRRTSRARTAVPTMRRPASATPRRVIGVAAASSSGSGRTTAVLDRPVEVSVEDGTAGSVMDAETETLSAVRVDEPPTRQIPAVGRRGAGLPVTEAAYEVDGDTSIDADDLAPPAPETDPPAQAAEAAESEAPMTTPRTPRPAPRRPAPGHGKAAVPPHVQRARRLVWFGATAVATLLLAFVFGGLWILLNLIADVALVAYLRHLRATAKQHLARKSRSQAPRAEARPAAPRAPERAPVQSQRRSAPRHRADSPAPRRAPSAPVRARATAPTAAGPEEHPEFIDLTDDAMSDDCPTTELTVARAV